MILIDVSRDDDVHWKADEGAVQCGYDEYSPRAQGLQQRPEKGTVAGQNVFDGFQMRLRVYADVPASPECSVRVRAASGAKARFLGELCSTAEAVPFQSDHSPGTELAGFAVSRALAISRRFSISKLSCSGNTVRRSSSTRPSSTRPMIGVEQVRSLVAN